MSCETVRLTVKRIVGLFIVAPVLILIAPLVALIVTLGTLFDTDSCSDFSEELKTLGSEYINTVKNLLLGRVE